MNKHNIAAVLLQNLDLGSSIAEQDTLLETARVETSAFSDLLQDKVDLIPGTKGSGKSALFRIFVDFLPQHLLRERKVVIAHGVQHHGDNVFHAFKDQFDTLSEDEFVSFWCIYLTSLAHEQFIKGDMYKPILRNAATEIARFREACVKARIPEIKARKSLKDILAWTLHVLRAWAPKLRVTTQVKTDATGQHRAVENSWILCGTPKTPLGNLSACSKTKLFRDAGSAVRRSARSGS